MPLKKKRAAKKKRSASAVAARAKSQKEGFAGTIVKGSKAQSFTTGTPNVATVKPPQFSTSASSAAVSMSTSELLARQRDAAAQILNSGPQNATRLVHPSQQHPQGISLTGMGQNPSQAPAVKKPPTQLYAPATVAAPAAHKQRNQPTGLDGAIIIGSAPKTSTVGSSPASKVKHDGRKRTRKKGKKKCDTVPDFMSPEKGVLILGTLRPADGQGDRFAGFDRSPAADPPIEYVPGNGFNGASTKPSRAGFGSGSSTGRLLKSDNSKPLARKVVRRKCRSASGLRQMREMEVLTSPRVSHSSGNANQNSQSASDLVLSWQPLGSPVRRMKRAMRFVQQNTCVTQRVTVDIGSAARLVIPCFEGITTISDVIETVRHRFPEYGITGLQQPLAQSTALGGCSRENSSRRAAWSKTNIANDSVRSAGSQACNGNVNGYAGEGYIDTVELFPGDFVSVAVCCDSALIAIGTNIPEGTMSENRDHDPPSQAEDNLETNENVGDAKNCDSDLHDENKDVGTIISTGGDLSSNYENLYSGTGHEEVAKVSSATSFARSVKYSAGKVPSLMREFGHLPKTPARNTHAKQTWLHDGQPREKAFRVNEIEPAPESESTSSPKVLRLSSPKQYPSPQLVLTSAREDPLKIYDGLQPQDEEEEGEILRDQSQSSASSPPKFSFRHRLADAKKSSVDLEDEKLAQELVPDLVSESAPAPTPASVQVLASKSTENSTDIATIVKHRLLHRIKALEDKGAISPSQRGYLNKLISAPTTTVPLSSSNDLRIDESDMENSSSGRTWRHPHRTLTPTDQVPTELLSVPAPPSANAHS